MVALLRSSCPPDPRGDHVLHGVATSPNLPLGIASSTWSNSSVLSGVNFEPDPRVSHCNEYKANEMDQTQSARQHQQHREAGSHTDYLLTMRVSRLKPGRSSTPRYLYNDGLGTWTQRSFDLSHDLLLPKRGGDSLAQDPGQPVPLCTVVDLSLAALDDIPSSQFSHPASWTPSVPSMTWFKVHSSRPVDR